MHKDKRHKLRMFDNTHGAAAVAKPAYEAAVSQ